MEIKINKHDITYISTSYVFTRMQVLIWIANGTGLLNMIEKDAGDILAEIIEEYNTDKPVVVNFIGINEIDDHALDSVFKALNDNKRQLIIIGGYHLMAIISKLKKNSAANLETYSDTSLISIGKKSQLNLKTIEKEKEDIIKMFIKETVLSSFIKFEQEKRLSSTPLIANGEYDSNYILSDNKKFIWISCFLSDKLREILDENKPKNVKLLSASLRGAPFAAILGLFHNIPFEAIDHFGPKHKVFDTEFIKRIEKGTSYIYIGDFAFGGTEIKIAKTYTEMKSSKLEQALVIGNLIDADVFKDDFELISLISLKNLHPDSEFKLQ